MSNTPVILKPLQRFSLRKMNASVLLFVSALLAMVWANSSWAHLYNDFLARPVILQISSYNLFSHAGETMSLLEFVNDALMSVFFLVVGLEIKQEILIGELSSWRKAMLPIVAACGGMIVPVLCFLFFCHTAPGMRGMAIPMATDIAFALAVLALLGKQVPASLKVFLTALAVADDIGGIIIIALFYNTGISIIPLLLSLGILLALYVGGRMFVNSNAFYLVGGFLVWMLFLESGVHPTIAGVLVAFTIPARPVIQLDKFVDTMDHLLRILPLAQSKKSPNATVLTSSQIQILKNIESTADGAISPLQDIMDDLNPLVDYLILPLFAFVNAGVALGSIPPESLSGVPLAVFAGLFIGKALGIFSFSYVFIRSGIVSYPSGMNRNNLMALSMLGGVGFTVSLFIANLSYTSLPGLGGDLLNQAKLGVFAGSLSAGVCGYFWLKYTLNKSGKKVFMR